MNKTKLKDCCLLNNYPQLDANTLSELKTNSGNIKLLPSSKDYDWVSNEDKAKDYICEGEVITLGKARYANIKYYKGKFVSANNVIVESFNQSILLTKYLYYYCLKNNKSFYIEGTTYPKFDINSFNNSLISIATIEEQEKLLSVLDTIQNLIDTQEKQLNLLDELIKSRFVEMFGDLKDTVRLGDCCDVHARIGWQALTQKEHMLSGEYMLITGTDFKNNEIDYSTCVYVSKERYEMDTHIILKNDDVLITKDGTIGKVAVVHNLPKPATLNGGVFVVRPDNRFNKEYISYVFKGPLFEEHVEKSKTGATIKHLNQKFLIEFKIPVPSMEKQIEFAEFSKQVDKSKFVYHSRYFLCDILTLFSSTIAYSRVVSILAWPNIF